MVSTWLYAADGRALYLVAVGVPMPMNVTYAGLLFCWNVRTGRYEQAGPTPVFPAKAATDDIPVATADQAPVLALDVPAALRPGMAPEAFRDEATRLLALTESRIIVTEDEKKLLRAIGTFVRTADVQALTQLASLF